MLIFSTQKKLWFTSVAQPGGLGERVPRQKENERKKTREEKKRKKKKEKDREKEGVRMERGLRVVPILTF